MSTQRMLEMRRRLSAWGKLLTPRFFPELKSKACAANPRLHLSGTSVLKNLVRAMRKFSLGVFGKTRSLARRTIADNHLYHGSEASLVWELAEAAERVTGHAASPGRQMARE